MLVVVSIILILMALLLPAMKGVKATAARTSCVSNLRQVSTVCLTYALDHAGVLPECNSANPGTFKWAAGTEVDKYLRSAGIPCSVWYCPSLRDNPWKIPAFWMNHETPWNNTGEFPIGYFYVGNPSSAAMHKFKKPVPRLAEQ